MLDNILTFPVLWSLAQHAVALSMYHCLTNELDIHCTTIASIIYSKMH